MERCATIETETVERTGGEGAVKICNSKQVDVCIANVRIFSHWKNRPTIRHISLVLVVGGICSRMTNPISPEINILHVK